MIELIGFDADDTLWDHELYYHEAKEKIKTFFDFEAEAAADPEWLDSVQKENILTYGYGVKSFILSSIELMVMRAQGGSVSADDLHSMIAIGKSLLTHPIEPFPGVLPTLQALSAEYPLVLITKGDLYHQERKIEESGLKSFFKSLHIVSEKSEATYERILNQLGVKPESFVMVGNSLHSDIVPVVKLGGHGVYIPSDYEWSLDRVEDEILKDLHFHQLSEVSESVQLIRDFS